MNSTLRKLLLVPMCAAVFCAGGTSTAIADRPVVLGPFGGPFTDLDPCTGEEQLITIFFEVYLHEHENNAVARLVRTGFTDAGYEMFNGSALQNFNASTGVFKESLVDMWRAEDGRMFQARGTVRIDTATGEVLLDTFRLKCLGQ